jgi:secondary thiamine-phosphate synthase enzyme
MFFQKEISLPPFSFCFHLITHLIENHLPTLPDCGLLHIFLKHTSAGLTINENADPTVRYDFETVMNRIVPESHRYEHDLEGNDDMPAHVKSSLAGISLTIPVTNRRLNLGDWQGVYLCEFRNRGGSRQLVLTVWS